MTAIGVSDAETALAFREEVRRAWRRMHAARNAGDFWGKTAEEQYLRALLDIWTCARLNARRVVEELGE